MYKSLIIIFLILFCGCIKYSFTGSTLPSHIKSVSIPLMGNKTSKIGLEQDLRDAVYNGFVSANILSVKDDNADAELLISIENYQNEPFEYDASGNVKRYKVSIQTKIDFIDIKKNESLYENTVTMEGYYEHATEDEDAGAKEALRKISEIIINNTVSGW